jgi:hypothetical protein
MSNDKKQTAVEWLINKIEDHFCLLPVDLIDQAKAMEREQIIDAMNIGFDDGSAFIEDIRWNNAEQYYNETYK